MTRLELTLQADRIDGQRVAEDRLFAILAVSTAAIIIFQLIGLGAYPLLGTTEGRYGEMAKKMLLSGQYLMPMFTDTEPFWGKPPLSLWLQVLSMQAFGINEFAARFPAWLCSLGTVLLTYHAARVHFGARVAIYAALIFSSSLLGHVAFGKVHTDAALTFSVALALLGIYQGLQRKNTAWLIAGLFGITLGLLAKGPVTLVYVGLPLFSWLLLSRKLWDPATFTKLAVGTTGAVALAAPWYIAAEIAYPGYLDYYLIGEHFFRFVDPGWMGDLYGAGHAEMRGTIVLFMLEGLLPWSLLVPAIAVATRLQKSSPRMIWSSLVDTNPALQFYLCWALTPLLFFALSANVVPPYAMPVLAAWSVILAIVLHKLIGLDRKKLFASTLLLALIFPTTKLVQNLHSDHWYAEPRNQKPLVDSWHQLRQESDQPLLFVGRRLYTAEFYDANLRYFKSVSDLPALNDVFVALREDRKHPEVPPHCYPRTSVNGYQLFYCTE